ncbi:hypothetical protein HPB50_019816 [Hyalomma asiaticum]|uniref:Uncharacterized protein n=1 Tax=Hyalomma asiaticum TaxID=266040 RepID=A0ACB7RVP7_HYAAI|nr:hypothetical protein HPB50_019816 [Hyalomma asiaticum]
MVPRKAQGLAWADLRTEPRKLEPSNGGRYLRKVRGEESMTAGGYGIPGDSLHYKDITTTTTRKPHLAFVAYLFLALPMALLCEALSPQTATGRRYHSGWKRQDRSAPKFRRLATAVELDNSYQREYYTVAEEVLEAYAQV